MLSLLKSRLSNSLLRHGQCRPTLASYSHALTTDKSLADNDEFVFFFQNVQTLNKNGRCSVERTAKAFNAIKLHKANVFGIVEANVNFNQLPAKFHSGIQKVFSDIFYCFSAIKDFTSLSPTKRGGSFTGCDFLQDPDLEPLTALWDKRRLGRMSCQVVSKPKHGSSGTPIAFITVYKAIKGKANQKHGVYALEQKVLLTDPNAAFWHDLIEFIDDIIRLHPDCKFVLAGDFNMTADKILPKLEKYGLVDASIKEKANTCLLPSTYKCRSARRIDHVFISKSLLHALKSFELVGKTKDNHLLHPDVIQSDHRGAKAVFDSNKLFEKRWNGSTTHRSSLDRIHYLNIKS